MSDRRAFRWTRRKADIALRAERDRYRAALETIAHPSAGANFRSIARAALDPTEAPDGLTPRQRAGLDPAESDWTGDPTEAPR